MRKFIFDQKYLLIDLDQGGVEKEPFKLLQLYHDDIKDIKLIKYQTTLKSAIFIFIHRNKNIVEQKKKEKKEEK